jgi:hypothetical protein
MKMFYFDTCILSWIREFDISQFNEYKIVYSEATMLDLKNSSDPEPEIEFLERCGAVCLSKNGSGLIDAKMDPRTCFETADPLVTQIFGPMLSAISGGGGENSMATSLANMVESLDGMDFDQAPLHQKINEDTSLNSVTAKEIARSMDIFTRKLPAQISDHYLQDLIRGLPPEEKAGFDLIFPPGIPNYDTILQAAIMLSLMGIGRPKGIRSNVADKSIKVAKRDVLDAIHISYALHCDGFITNDKASLLKFRLLNTYWKLGKEYGNIVKGRP